MRLMKMSFIKGPEIIIFKQSNNDRNLFLILFAKIWLGNDLTWAVYLRNKSTKKCKFETKDKPQ